MAQGNNFNLELVTRSQTEPYGEESKGNQDVEHGSRGY